MPTDPYPELKAGVHYYLEVQADVNDNCFVLVSDNYIGDYCWYNDGSGVWVRSDVMFGQDSDMFFELHSETLALQPLTWAGIKSLF